MAAERPKDNCTTGQSAEPEGELFLGQQQWRPAPRHLVGHADFVVRHKSHEQMTSAFAGR